MPLPTIDISSMNMTFSLFSWAVTKSGTGTWDGDMGRGHGTGTWDGDVGRGRGTRGRGTRGHAGTRGQTTPNICAEFVEYNFRWSHESYFMLESL